MYQSLETIADDSSVCEEHMVNRERSFPRRAPWRSSCKTFREIETSSYFGEVVVIPRRALSPVTYVIDCRHNG